MVTSERVLFIKSTEYDYRTVYEINYQELKSMAVVEETADEEAAESSETDVAAASRKKSYLEVALVSAGEEDNEVRSLRFKLENKQIANSLANQNSIRQGQLRRGLLHPTQLQGRRRIVQR